VGWISPWHRKQERENRNQEKAMLNLLQPILFSIS